MTGMQYNCPFSAVSVSLAQDLWELLAPSDAVIRAMSIKLSQEDLVAVEMLRVTLQRVTGAPTSGSGGSTVTPQPTHGGYAAAGSVVEINNTTRLTGGTATILFDDYVQVTAGGVYVPILEEMIFISPSTRLVVGLEVAPSGASNMSGVLSIVELGG